MPRPCGPCSDPHHNELDRRLLQKEISGESFRQIAADFGYSETALRRHLSGHLNLDLSEVHQAMAQAKEEALAEVHQRELEGIRNDAQEGMAARLQNAANYLDQLKELRSRAASLLDRADGSEDLKACGVFLRELRELIRLMGELEGRLASQPQINILINPQWIELRTLIIKALEPYPAAREAVIHAIHE
jgi:hypothetical protein